MKYREFKFRAWDSYHQEMINWSQYKDELVSKDFINHGEGPLVVMQHTGLKDKNGKEIYEGDILLQKTTEEFKKYNPTVWEKTWEVVWGYHDIDPSSYPRVALGFHLKDVKSGMLKTIGDLEQDCLDNCYPYEVIGNIYENPELLEQII